MSLSWQQGSFSPAPAKGVNKVLRTGFSAQSDLDDYDRYAAQIVAKFSAIQQQMMDPGSSKTVNSPTAYPPYGTERVLWGTLDGGRIGYLRVNLMALNTLENSGGPEQWVDNIRTTMDQVMLDFTSTEAMIIDMRLNGGGIDGVAMEIASRFNPTDRWPVGKYSRTISGNGEIQWAQWPVANPAAAYSKPIVILDSATTVSAGEVFMLAMKDLPNVTIIGETTYGSLSDVLTKTLPNGWQLGLSNEVYIDAQYQEYEVTGVAPDMTIEPFLLSDIEQNKDTALDTAIKYLQ